MQQAGSATREIQAGDVDIPGLHGLVEHHNRAQARNDFDFIIALVLDQGFGHVRQRDDLGIVLGTDFQCDRFRFFLAGRQWKGHCQGQDQNQNQQGCFYTGRTVFSLC